MAKETILVCASIVIESRLPTKASIQITGITGYIGFKVLYLAVSQGYRVRGVVRKEEQISKIKSHSVMNGLTSGVEFVVIPDLGQAGAFDSVLDGVSAIIHLASPLAKEARRIFLICASLELFIDIC
jgi:nucleoside-diphosphate-sugar epimerase